MRLPRIAGTARFSNLFVVLKQGVPPPYPTIDAAQKAGAVTLNYCAFINTCIIFLIIAFSDFLLIRMINKLREQEAPATPEEIVLLRDIRDSLKE
jgi:large conductance mechanosensitive channel